MQQLLSSRSTSWTLLDQALVSGANFGMGVMLARYLGIEAFGAYVIAQTYLLYANTFQSALVVSPMMTSVPAEPNEFAQHRLLRGFFAYMVLVLLLTVAGVQGLAWLLSRWAPALGLGVLAFPLGVAMASYQMQDWLRRSLYVRQESRAVFLGDLVAYGMQFGLLVYFASTDALSADRAIWVQAASFASASFLVVLYLRLVPDFLAIGQVLRTNWRASRDFLASWQLQWVASSGVILIGTAFIGPQAAGAIRAVQNLLGPVNVFFQWMDNVMPVRAVARLREGGRDGLAAYLRRINWLGMLVLGSFALILLPIDGWLMAALYGEAYRPFAVLVVFQALYYLFGHAYRMQSYYNRAIGQTQVLARASLWWAVVAVAVAFFLVGWLAERGIMLALVLGEVAALVYLLWVRHAAVLRAEPAEDRHMQWRRGGTRLVLPLVNRHVLRGALSMYFPSRWTGKLYRTVLSMALPVWAKTGLAPRLGGLANWCVHLPRLVQAVPGARAEWVGGLQGFAGSRAKLTLRLMDARGNALAYGRVAEAPAAVAVVQREAQVLKRLALTAAADHVPRLIDQGVLDEPGGYYLLESAGSEQATAATLDQRHFNFLASLVEPGPPRPWGTLLGQLAEELEPVLGAYPTARDVWDSLHQLDGPVLPRCIEHGDFAPWNIREQADGRLFVIDWEHSLLDGLPWFDALHFRFQQDSLVLRKPVVDLLKGLCETFSLPCARAYLSALPPAEQIDYPLAALYLLRTLALGQREGRASADGSQTVRVKVLEGLMMTRRK